MRFNYRCFQLPCDGVIHGTAGCGKTACPVVTEGLTLVTGSFYSLIAEPGENTQHEWCIIAEGGPREEEDPVHVVRRRLDKPSACDTLWDKWEVKLQADLWYQVNGDGSFAIGFLPWNRCYRVDRGGSERNGRTDSLSVGCWSSVSKDSSRYWFHLNWPHHSLVLFRDSVRQGVVYPRFNHSEGDGKELYHPGWATSGGRILTLTAGYSEFEGVSAASEVFVGRFTEDYTELKDFARITRDENSSTFPDAWVGVSEKEPAIIDYPDTIVGDDDGFTFLRGADTLEMRISHKTPVLRPGDTVTIAWKASESISGVTMQITFDAGLTWKDLLNGSLTRKDTSWGEYRWNIPRNVTEIAGFKATEYSAIVRICSYFDPSTHVSSKPFAVRVENAE